MKASLLTVTLVIVLGASALNLGLGAVWVAVLIAVILLRRRVRFAAGLVLLLVLGVGAAGIRLGWFMPTLPASYAVDEVSWLLERVASLRASSGAIPGTGGTGHAGPGEALRARLKAQREEELRYTAADFERRAAAAVGLSRSAGRLRARAPGEIAGLEEAVRRLALTLTSPEFRDLEGRRSRLQSWFRELEARFAVARDETEVQAVALALDPAAMAPVSLRAVREDLARVDAATRALVRALGGGEVSVTATSTMRYDEAEDQVLVEDRYLFGVEPPLRIVRVEVGALRRRAVGQGLVQSVAHEPPGAAPQDVGGSDEIALGSGAARVAVVDRRRLPAATRPVRSVLKHVPFGRFVVDRGGGPPGEFLVSVGLESVGGPEALLPLGVPPPRLERITAPRYALHYVSLPGAITTGEAHDLWVPATPETAADRSTELVIEALPASVLFRNAAFAWLKGYLYRPNLAATLVLTGLAALTAVLIRRRRAAPPPGPA